MKGAELYQIVKAIQEGEMITQEQLAERAGIGRANLVNMINDEQRREKVVSVRTLQKLLAAFPKYFEGAKKIAAEQKIELPPVGAQDVPQLKAIVNALLHHYCQHLENTGIQRSTDTMAEVMDAAMKNLTKFRV